MAEKRKQIINRTGKEMVKRVERHERAMSHPEQPSSKHSQTPQLEEKHLGFLRPNHSRIDDSALSDMVSWQMLKN